MKMEIKKEIQTFKDWIKILRTIGEEQSIKADAEGLHVVGMDPSHVAMIKTDFKKELFEEYSVEGDEEVSLNVQEFSKILDRIAKDERVILEKNVERAKFLLMVKKGTRVRQFSLPILDSFDAEVPEPKIFFKAKSRITLEEFNLGLNDASLVSEHIALNIADELMKLEGFGDMGDTLAQWDKDSEGLLELKAEEDAKATFTLSYIIDMVKASKPLAEVLTIELSTDMPIRIEAECNTPYIKAEYYLAPCIGV